VNQFYTEADDSDVLREQVRDAVEYHFEAEEKSKLIRLY